MLNRNCHFSLAAIVVWCCACAAEAQERVSFRAAVAPILRDHCQACHGAKKAEGGYRVDTFEQLGKPGDSGEAPLVASKKDESELLRRIACEDASERMPAEAPPLSTAQIELVGRWIEEGAQFDGEAEDRPLSLVIPPPTYAAPPASYPRVLPITACVFSPDGAQLIVGGYHELLVWDVASQHLVRRIQNVGERVHALAWTVDARILAVACGQPGRRGEVRLIDFAKGEVQGVVCRVDDVVLDIALRPGTSQLAAACTDGSIRIYDVETLQAVRVLSSHADWVTSVAWSDDGQWLASGSRDKSVKVYQADSGQLTASYLGHTAAVNSVCFMPDGKQLMSSAASEVHRWEAASANKLKVIGMGSPAGALLRSQASVLVACQDGRIAELNLLDDTIARWYTGQQEWAIGLAWQPDSAPPDTKTPLKLAGGSFDGALAVWNSGQTEPLYRWTAKP